MEIIKRSAIEHSIDTDVLTLIETERDESRDYQQDYKGGNIVKETKKKPSPAGGKLPGHFAMAVYDETTGK